MTEICRAMIDCINWVPIDNEYRLLTYFQALITKLYKFPMRWYHFRSTLLRRTCNWPAEMDLWSYPGSSCPTLFKEISYCQINLARVVLNSNIASLMPIKSELRGEIRFPNTIGSTKRKWNPCFFNTGLLTTFCLNPPLRNKWFRIRKVFLVM
jgi:hypothetical protein